MAKTPEMKGNKLSFLYSLSRFLPNFLQSSDATITVKLAKSSTPADKNAMYDLSSDSSEMTHLGVIKKAGLDPDVPANYNWIARNISVPIEVRYATDGTGTGMSATDAAGMTHIGILKATGLNAATASNYTWISRTVPEAQE